MLSETQLVDIRTRIESGEVSKTDAITLMNELVQLQSFMKDFSANMNARLADIEKDMTSLEQENARLRKVNESTYFERDACVALIAKLAKKQGMTVGIGKFEVSDEKQNRVVLDLPSGQVSWEFLESEAHLFQELPEYQLPLQDGTVQDNYLKVMNPNLGN